MLSGPSEASQLALAAAGYQVEGGQTPLHHLKLDPVSSLDEPGGRTGMVPSGLKVTSVSHVYKICEEFDCQE